MARHLPYVLVMSYTYGQPAKWALAVRMKVRK